jgi:hypothetical protein
MVTGAVLGVVSAVVHFSASRSVASTFQQTAPGAGVSTADVDAVAGVIRAVFFGLGLVTLGLAIAVLALAVGILQGRNGARITTLALVVVALVSGLGGSSYTVLGRDADWTMNVAQPSDQLSAQVGQAYAQSLPGVLVGASGGLTDLQSLGYIAVAVLLLLPSARAHFRRSP